MSTHLLGSQTARIEVIPEGTPHPRWDEIADYISQTGTALDPWQERVLHTSFLTRGDLYAAFTVGACAPRQNGKNGITEMRELAGAHLLGEELVIHTAHLADTSKEAFRRLDDIIDANEWLSADVRHIWRTNGHEAIEFRNGSRIRFRTRTRGGGRGFSAPVVIFDEAMFLPTVSFGAILPVISAQPNPQIWFVGSAVDQTKMEDGVEFARVREQALGGGHDRLAYFEWSLDYETPEDVPDGLDMDAIAISNPAFGIRISADYIAAEYKTLDPRTHAVERNGVGDWPPTDGSVDLLIDPGAWNALAEPSELCDPVCASFDTWDEFSAIAISGINDRGELQVEVLEARPGTRWVPGRMEQLYREREIAEVVCDEYGPSGAMATDVDKAGITVRRVKSGDFGNACVFFADSVNERTMRHLGQSELDSALRGAKARPLVDRWAWSRTNSTANISPLIAATLALWSGHENGVGEVEIF